MTTEVSTMQTSQSKESVEGKPSDQPQRERRPNPLNIAYEQKRAEIDARIKSLQDKLDSLKSGDDGTMLSLKGERGRLVGQLRALREQVRVIRIDAGKLKEDLQKVQEDIGRQHDDVKAQKDKLPLKSIAEIDSKIASYEQRIETGSFTLTEEKQILQEISRLRKNRRTLEILESGGSLDGVSRANDLATLKMREEMLRSKMTSKYAEADPLKEQIQSSETELTKLDGGKEAAAAKEKQRNNEIEKLKKTIDAEYDKRRALFEEHKAAKTKQKETWERNKARREEEEKRRVVEDQVEELEHKLETLNPAASIDKRISECVNLSNYFTALLPTETSSKDVEERKPVAIDGDGEFVALKPKSQRSELYVAPAKKKSVAPSQQQHQQQPQSLGKLPIQILAALADLHLSVPTSHNLLPDLLKSIDAKKGEFEGQRAKAMESIREQETEIKSQITALQAHL